MFASSWAAQNGVKDLKSLSGYADFSKAVLDAMNKFVDTSELKGYEKIRGIFVDSTPFANNDLLSNTLKLIRRKAQVIGTHYG